MPTLPDKNLKLIEASVRQGKCIPAPMGCGGPAVDFRDTESALEYNVSGWCQECQDKIFAPGNPTCCSCQKLMAWSAVDECYFCADCETTHHPDPQ